MHRRARRLSYITVGYNVGEGVLSILAGLAAGSIALVGFGLDSFVESLSGTVMVWRFRPGGHTRADEKRIEARATRLVAVTFFVLAAYVSYEALRKLAVREVPEPSLLGIAIAVASLVLMPALYVAKLRTGRALGSRSLIADSRETLACAFLSAALLIGLALNYGYGLWWADPAVGIVIVAFLVREGAETLASAKREVS